MCPSRLSVLLAAVAWAVLAPIASAQQSGPRVAYIYPAGAPQGAKLEVTIGGQHLEGFSYAHVSGRGVQAEWVSYFKPKDAATPSVAEVVTLLLTVSPNAEPGQREFRLASPNGLTNPQVFFIGSSPEFREKASAKEGPREEMNVTLPTMINGRIMPGEVDRFRFQGRKGQKLTFAVAARQLIPYIPDAVPGWFQAVLAIYDSRGEELAFVDDFRFRPDPVIYFEVPKDGEYVLEIRDAIYRGRQDFVYRIAAGELPYITDVFPLGARVGSRTTAELTGWNLPVPRLVPDTRTPGIQWLSVRRPDPGLSQRRMELILNPELKPDGESSSGTELVSNRLPFAVDTLPECLEKEPNNTPETAQQATLPIIVNGRIGQPGDWDVMRFQGRAGEEVVAEVFARRLGSPLDSVLRLTDASGRQVAFNDDYEDPGAGLVTHHADSMIRTKLPASGTYYLQLGDVQNKGGAEYAYRLRLGPRLADFQLRVVPSGINVLGGATTSLNVFALRKDGFSGPIDLALKDPPPGFSLGGARLPAGQDQVRLTLSAPPVVLSEPISLQIEGRAAVDGQEVVRAAQPSEYMMQAFAYWHLVPVDDLKVIIPGQRSYRTSMAVDTPLPVKIPSGATGKLDVVVRSSMSLAQIRLMLDEPPDGISIQSQSAGPTGTSMVLHCDGAKIKPGLKGNLVFNAFGLTRQETARKSAIADRRGTPLGMLPAVPFEVVEAK